MPCPDIPFDEVGNEESLYGIDPMRIETNSLKKRSVCLWIVCPETGGVKKFRLSIAKIAVVAFIFSFGIGSLFGVVIDYHRLAAIKDNLSSLFSETREAKNELHLEKRNLEARLQNIQDDNNRYQAYESDLRKSLAKLEMTIQKALNLRIVEKEIKGAGHLNSKAGIGGAEVPCTMKHSNILSCQKVISEKEDEEEAIEMPPLNSSDTSDLLMTLNTYTDFLNRIPLGPPLLGDTSSGYGFRRSVFRRGLSFHKGTDYTLENGKMVHATADGTVSKVNFDRTYGRVIDVDHGNGISTRYAHLARSLVFEGQRVARGEKIALAGNSGMSTGPHLHYEVRVNRRSRDPLKYVRLAKDLNLILKN